MGLRAVLPAAELAWVADNDKAASALLGARYPGIPNLGDIKEIDWSTVEPVDILTAGYPCQPFSDAGLQGNDADPRNLIGYILKAIRFLRPKIVILENVPGHRRRGFGRLLTGLASLGFHARWHSVRASHAGALHKRERIIVLAYPADNGQQWPWSPWDRRNGFENRSPGESWASIIGRPEPVTLEIGPKGNARLSFGFSEWLMGLPNNWVTGFGFPRTATARLIGNGVCPQQMALAIRGLFRDMGWNL